MQVDSLPAEPQEKPKNTEVGSLSLLQWIFLTQELNQGLLHCRWILYQLSYQGSPGFRKKSIIFLPNLIPFLCLKSQLSGYLVQHLVQGRNPRLILDAWLSPLLACQVFAILNAFSGLSPPLHSCYFNLSSSFMWIATKVFQ